jgi:transposase InsO family protein
VEALRKKRRKDRGQQPSLPERLRLCLGAQHAEHPGWTARLHFDNLLARLKQEPALGALPSYATVRRFLKRSGLNRQRLPRAGAQTAGERCAIARLEQREVRRYEVEHVGALWHLDFHHGSLPVLLKSGAWVKPILLGILDDHSRLACHLQWYLNETAEQLVHGLSQAILKRGRPRALMTDGGAAMVAAETRAGLLRLGIHHEQTLPYSPYQNGKQEAFWRVVEGRALAMLEGVSDLDLELLNRATLAWVEQEYNRSLHSETGQAPLDRFLNGADLLRPAPEPEDLRLAFTRTARRAQRKGDGTVSVGGIHFEIPSRYRALPKTFVRYAEWDLSRVFLVDPETDRALAPLWPVNASKNASGERRRHAEPSTQPTPPKGGIAPRLAQLMAEYALSGLPPAYVPCGEGGEEQETR